MISYFIHILFSAIYLVILLVVLLSWIPIFDVKKEPIATLIRIYKAIMAPFSFIPPIGMIDITPLVAFIVLQIIERLLITIFMGLGL